MARDRESYDVVVLDIMLPARNGYDVLRNMREADVWIPTLMLSAKNGVLDQTDAFELGAWVRNTRGGVLRLRAERWDT